MNKQAFNPYLPSWEYVPDGEPHVFGDRIYIYGSHDHYNGYVFCMGDYVYTIGQACCFRGRGSESLQLGEGA